MTTITQQIVSVNTTVTLAPTPSTYQRSGAFVSVGGTTLTEGTFQYLESLSSLASIISTEGNYLELGYMNGTFFAQPAAQSGAIGVYVLELGVQGTVEDGIDALETWITANPNIFYSYLCSASWDASGADLATLAANYESPSGKTYFFPTTTSGTIAAYAGNKAIIATVPSPNAASSEFQAAAIFYQWLANNPSASFPAAPMAYRYVYGVTPWPATGYTSTITTILSAYGNIIGTGAEGGISTSIIFKGTTMDGNQAMWWYAVDWLQINAKLLLAAAVINGSNSIPPLVYNQAGINQLLSVLTDLGADGVAFLLLLSATFSATPFTQYVTQNPSAYAAGSYGGFSAIVTSQNGFLTITFDIDATQFAA